MLGHGSMGRAHNHALNSIPYMFWPSTWRPRLITIAARREDPLAEAAVRYGYESYTTDWREMLRDERISVFDNVAPNEAHVEPSLVAIGMGKHVVCEKPLALSAADARTLADAAAASGVQTLTCFNYRFLPAVGLARELIQGGELGQIYHARFRYSQDWRWDSLMPLKSPAGALAMIGCHAIDQARFLVGEIVKVAGAISSPVMGGREGVDATDVVQATLAFAGGCSGTLEASLVATGRKNRLAWEISGSAASIEWNLEELNLLRVYRRAHGRTAGFADVIACGRDMPLGGPWWGAGHLLGWEHGHTNMLAHFLECVAADRSPAPEGATFEDGARAAEVADAVVRAAASSAWEATGH